MAKRKKSYVRTRKDGEVFLVSAEDEFGAERPLSVFRGTYNQCQSFTSSLVAGIYDSTTAVIKFQKLPLFVVDDSVVIEGERKDG